MLNIASKLWVVYIKLVKINLKIPAPTQIVRKLETLYDSKRQISASWLDHELSALEREFMIRDIEERIR